MAARFSMHEAPHADLDNAMTTMTTPDTPHPGTNSSHATVLTNSCPTEGGQLTRSGVYFAEFTYSEHSFEEPVGAATADHDQLRWSR